MFKRLVRCEECGHQFYSSTRKPRCSQCNGTHCSDVPINEQNNQPQYQQQPFAQSVEAAPEPQVFYEQQPRQSAPTRSPTPSMAELKQVMKECVREEVANAASQVQYQPPQYYPSQYYPPAMDAEDKEELQALRDEQDRQARVEERIRDFCGDDTEVIHNPDYVNSNDKEVRVGWIDYDTGKPRAAIAVSEERYHKLLDVEEKERAEECGKESIKDIARLNRCGKMAVKEGEAMKLSPEERRGISAGAILGVLAIGGAVAVGYWIFNKYLAAKSVQADAEDPNVDSLRKNILMSNKVLRDRFIQSGGRLEV